MPDPPKDDKVKVDEGKQIPDIGKHFKKKKVAGKNALSRPINMKKLLETEFNTQSNNVIDEASLEAISRAWAELKVSEEVQQKVAIDIVMQCVDVGSSRYSNLIGKSPHCDRSRSELIAIVKEVSTLRRFCMYYAKVAWNILLTMKTPPSNWAKKGFNYDTAFAAFDFFIGVTDESALEPEGGLVRDPTKKEIKANLAFAETKIYRQGIAEGNKISNLGEISGCSIGNVANNPFSRA